ncbi:hypothetical protein ACFYKX_08200 [Cytobacillus sp. FJAT-54145]|uniref:Lipoprotein n=1 Tax=Cytobacillus spartinae TaxID=3299023 RepID=A0ABW6KCH4_9BACI
MGKLKYLFVLSASFIILAGCSNNENAIEETANETVEMVEEDFESIATGIENQINEVETTVDQAFVTEGETAELSTTAFIAYNEDAYNEIYDIYDIRNFTEEFRDMVADNEIQLLEEGTEFEVLETDVTQAKVMNIETENIGFIHLSLLSQVSS